MGWSFDAIEIWKHPVFMGASETGTCATPALQNVQWYHLWSSKLNLMVSNMIKPCQTIVSDGQTLFDNTFLDSQK